MRAVFALMLLPLGACQWMGRTADSIGDHLPTLGEPCEHWQCVTSEGQRKSDEIKAQKQQPAQ